MNNTIKFDNTEIHAYIVNGKLLDRLVRITVAIDIDQFRTWLVNNHYDSVMRTRELWDDFCKYIENIIKYGYHFNNITTIRHFVDVDAIILNYASIYNINVCTAGEVDNVRIADDQNSILFDLIAEAYSMDDDPDASLQPVEEETNEEKHEEVNEEEYINNLPNTVEELEAQMLGQFEQDHIAHAQIADTLMMNSITECSNEDFFQQLAIVPKITSHVIDGDLVSFKLTITKKAFIAVFELYRDRDSETAWDEFYNHFSSNPNSYTPIIHASNFSEYTNDNDIILDKMQDNIYNIERTNNNKAIRFWTDATLDHD